MDLEKYIQDKDGLEMLSEIKACMDTQSPFELGRGDFSFLVEPQGPVLDVWRNEKSIALYKNLEDFCLNFKIDGVPFIEIIGEFEFIF